jgi:flagellar protein FlaI
LDKNSTTSKNNILEIEKLIDQIISKNKQKLQQTYLQSIEKNNLNSNKRRIFYIKKQNKTKIDNKISGEIISQARKNLREEPLEEDSEEEIQELEVLEDSNPELKEKKHERFKRKVKYDEKKEIHKTEDITDSKEFDEIVVEINKFFKIKEKDNKNVDSKITDKINKKDKIQKNIEEAKIQEEEKKVETKNLKKEKISNIIDLSFSDSTEEHVFFDEDDSDFKGWSPHISEKEKKKLSLSLSSDQKLESKEVYTVTKDFELPKEIPIVNSVKLSDLGFSENEWDELEFYPLYEPYSYVKLLQEKETLEKCYFLIEINLSEEEKQMMDFINDTIKNIKIDVEEMEEKGDYEYLEENVNNVIKEYNLKIETETVNKILYYMVKSSLGLGKIDPLMRDPNIEDISCDGAGVPLFLYHRKLGSLKSNIQFDTADDLNSFVHRLAQKCGKHISIAEPILDATMPDGSRIQMTLSDEITAKGSTFTIRKFRANPFSPPDLFEFNTMSSEMIAYMWLAVENGINMLFAGGTASGKTTTLNALSLFIPRESKIVSIEETREINLPHPNWVPGVARTGFGQVLKDKMVGEIDLYDLMKAALRQRPEYILVGEIRGREAYVLFQAMATGHATYSTIHADSAHSLIHRLEGKPINIPRVLLQSLDVVSLHIITRVKNKRVRRCKQIIEIIDIDPTTKEILTNEVFRWDPVDDNFVYSGKSYVLESIRAEKDMSREEMTEEIRKRKRLIEIMDQKSIKEFRDVANLVVKYCENSEETMKELERDVKK